MYKKDVLCYAYSGSYLRSHRPAYFFILLHHPLKWHSTCTLERISWRFPFAYKYRELVSAFVYSSAWMCSKIY